MILIKLIIKWVFNSLLENCAKSGMQKKKDIEKENQ
jgi:hypothetical protein